MRSIDLQPLRALFHGDLITPEHGHYPEACRLWNASVNKRPALIARCSGLADIIAAVDFGRENGLLTAVRGGGHNVGGRALCDDGLVIDLSQMRTASRSESDDLFWALRGGGGNFGVVASFEFSAHPVRTVLGGLLLYPREAAAGVIRHFRGYVESAPEELTAYVALLHGPDGAPLVGVIPCYCGGSVEGERVLEPLRTFGSPVADTIQEVPFPTMQALLASSFPDGNHNYWKSTLQRELSDDAIAAIVEHANRMTSPLSAVVLEYYGGAAGRVPSTATAFPHRALPWDILFVAHWTDPAETSTHRDWARAGEESLRPYSANAHLQSALDVEPQDVIDTAFGPNLPRLAAIKAKYDPDNFFRVNYNITPARTVPA